MIDAERRDLRPASRVVARGILDSPEVIIYRFGPLERWILPGAILGFFGWVGLEQIRVGDAVGWMYGTAIVAVSCAIAWTMAFRVLLAFTPDWVLVREPAVAGCPSR